MLELTWLETQSIASLQLVQNFTIITHALNLEITYHEID